ncbi:hypothetical protein O3438_33385 [Micromonospora sp. WMMC250]|nr:hypothetical protein [Micromonospora sp. WMMC250]MCZ7379796.1 hypothetical protein [Micromonospora sp. WMMC250]
MSVIIAVIAALAVASAAGAAPSTPSPSGHQQSSPLLRDVLESTARGFASAKNALDKSRKRQLVLALEIAQIQGRLDTLTPQVSHIAVQSYRQGRLGPVAALLTTASPDSFVARATMLEDINRVNARKITALTDARKKVAAAKASIDAEVRQQQRQAATMAKQKQATEKQLALLRGPGLADGLVAATSPVAKPAPGFDGGSWPAEACNKPDPTTSGCVTSRTLHAYTEVKRAGFTRFVGCHRSGGPYEHPKGRACDWSLQSRGFSPAQTRDQKMYGNNLTAFLVRNAERLGIYYVIWYRQIWFPATGWKSYSGPSDHTDHVHMSML